MLPKISFNKVNSKTDIKELAKLAKSIWYEYWLDGNCITENQVHYMIDKFQSETAMTNQMNNEKYTYYFINFQNKNIGYFAVSPKVDYLFLSKLYIQKEYRAKGIGHKSFEKIKEISEYNKIILTVNKYNLPTVETYKKWGFKIIDSVITDIGSGFVMDDYIMSYNIQCE